jgi:general secretion pathway protein K
MGLGETHMERESIMTQPRPIEQHGAALLMAMLAAALITALLTTALWRQSNLIQIESTERQKQQGEWLLMGAMDWGRLILREDARSGGADHLSEPWAVPLRESRLSSFLNSSGQTVTDIESIALADQVYLSGGIEDAQGKFNLTNLIQGQELDPQAIARLTRLFALLGLPSAQAPQLAQHLLDSQSAKGRLLRPRTIDDLQAWGWDRAALERLRPHVTILPERSTLNINTASPEVLAATLTGLDLSQAQRLAQIRMRSPWTQTEQAQQAVGNAYDATLMGINSNFFLLHGQIRMGSTKVGKIALVKRENLSVSYLWVLPRNATAQP